MALFLRQDDKRSQLQERLAAELQERMKQRQDIASDGLEDPAYTKNTKQTSSLAWVWILIAVFAVALVIYLIFALAG